MDGDEIVVLQRAKHIQTLVRILTSILFHRGDQRLSVTAEERIVMAKAFPDVLLERVANMAGRGEPQKGYGNSFPGLHSETLSKSHATRNSNELRTTSDER